MTTERARRPGPCGASWRTDTKELQNYIDGKWLDAADGRCFDVFDPSNGEEIATAPDSQPEDVERAIDGPEPHSTRGPGYASEMANRVADRVVQIFGGRGYMRENVAERFYRELRVDRIWEGTSEIQRLIIAGQLFKRGIDLACGS